MYLHLPMFRRRIGNFAFPNRKMAASKQHESKEEDFNYKTKYKAYKRRLKLLVYEQEYFKSLLEKIEQSLIVVERDKSYVLDQLLQYENVSQSEDDSSDGFSDTELHPTPKGQSLTPAAPGSGTQQGLPLRDKKTPTSKVKQLETASGAKKGTRAAVDGAAKKGGVKRGTASVKGATPAKKVRKAVKPSARSAVKGLEVKTVSKTVQRGASKVEEVIDDNELVISLPRPGPTPKTHLPGPIPNAPPTQFLDASSSSSSSSSGSDSSGSGNSSDSNDDSGTETTAVKPKVSLSVPSSAPPPLHMDEHAYGIPTKGVPPSSVPTSVGGARVVKLPEMKSEQSNMQHAVTAKPTPHRPSVLVSTIKGHSLGTIPSPLISPVAAAQRSPPSASGSFSFKWSNRPPDRTGVETSPVITGFVPLVGVTQDDKGKSPVVDGPGMATKRPQATLNSPLGSSAFHIVSPTSSPTKT